MAAVQVARLHPARRAATPTRPRAAKLPSTVGAFTVPADGGLDEVGARGVLEVRASRRGQQPAVDAGREPAGRSLPRGVAGRPRSGAVV